MSPRVNVVICDAQRTLFERIEDDRIAVHPRPAADLRPDFIVFPCHRQDGAFLTAARAVPAAYWRRAASGGAMVVFDNSGEGMPPKAALLKPFHEFMETYGLTPERCVLVTQNRLFEPIYRRMQPAPHMPV